MDYEDFKSESEDKLEVDEEAEKADESTFQEAVDRLSKGNPKSFNFYLRLVGRQTLAYTGQAHDARLCHNLQTNFFSPSVAGRFEAFPLASGLPVPIDAWEGSSCFCSTDSALQPQLEKMRWKEEVHAKWMLINSTDSRLKKLVKHRENIYSMPKYLMEFAQLLDGNPEPFQDSKFDWFFSGRGNLHHFDIGGTSYLLQAVHNKMCITPFCWQGNSIRLEHSKLVQFECNEALPINEISIYTADGLEICIAARSRCDIRTFIVGICRETEKLFVYSLGVFKSEVPATSVTYLDKITAVCTYVDNTLHIKDTLYDKDTIINLPNKFQKDNNWLSVNILDNNNFLVANKREIFVFDKRTSCQKVNILINDVTDLCEEITLLHKSTVKESCFYVGSYHRLFMSDVRFWDSRPFMMSQRWTHGMQTAPLFACSAPFEGYKEVICLANQVPSDVRLVLDTYTQLHLDTDTIPSSSVMPWSPKSLHDSLRYAQLRGFCIDPRINVKKRLNMSITGISVVRNDIDNPVILLHNSCGDIFQNQLLPNGHQEQKNVPEIFESWSERMLRSKPAKSIAVSSRENIAPFVHDQLGPCPSEMSPPEKVTETTNIPHLGKISVERSLEQELLSTWNVEADALPWTVS